MKPKQVYRSLKPGQARANLKLLKGLNRERGTRPDPRHDPSYMDHARNLINALQRHGVYTCMTDVPEVLRVGADQYVSRKGKEISAEDMTELHMILREMREA